MLVKRLKLLMEHVMRLTAGPSVVESSQIYLRRDPLALVTSLNYVIIKP